MNSSAASNGSSLDASKTHIDISLVQMDIAGLDSMNLRGNLSSTLQSKHFFYKKPNPPDPLISRDENDDAIDEEVLPSQTLVEVTVANSFPCALSRQCSLLTSEIRSSANI